MPRTENPKPGERLPLPNHFAVVEQVAQDFPGYLAASCQSHGGTWQFMDTLVARLRELDTRWGYNGKRGNADDPSHDAIAYNYSTDRDEGTTNVYIIDVIGGHCGGDPRPAWIDQTDVTRQKGEIGRWTMRGDANPGGGGGGGGTGTTTCRYQAFNLAGLVTIIEREGEATRRDLAVAIDETRQVRALLENINQRLQQGLELNASARVIGAVRGWVRG